MDRHRLTVLLKMTSPTGRTTTRQYQNIQQVEPDPSLFTIPQGYTIVIKSQNTSTTATSTPH